jgi:hypothetical protein
MMSSDERARFDSLLDRLQGEKDQNKAISLLRELTDLLQRKQEQIDSAQQLPRAS